MRVAAVIKEIRKPGIETTTFSSVRPSYVEGLNYATIRVDPFEIDVQLDASEFAIGDVVDVEIMLPVRLIVEPR